ncbi:carbohydrate deacetylase [Candidatus Uabimicrobium amorphum]|uniref:Carbohydrate deacetylase n=1 Tax=Uabimicrobium amorphum TaxID=2596890 RepID=A0A5S9ISR9_UABAM|nr:ChbG/HpnK family deacetylase [Candidatus Uabimicrobium amorphum]BBM85975.1 carbohydrate deacetylase [Candidatus Uabimicrobium amorphum]
MLKYLIVNADDLGISPGVSSGILHAHKMGIVTSTTAMVNTAFFRESIQTAMTESVGIGLHITLSYGAPVLPASEVPSLVDKQGNFLSFPIVAPFNAQELQSEIEAQFSLFTEVAGCLPDHIDSHQFMANVHPAAFKTVLNLAKDHQIPIRNPHMFLSKNKLHQFMRSRKTNPLAELDGRIEELQQIYAHFCVAHPDFFEYRFFDTGVTVDNLLEILRNLPTGVTEIMCHPGYSYDLQNDYYLEKRDQEVEVLTNERILQAIQDEGIQLVTFGQIESIHGSKI